MLVRKMTPHVGLYPSFKEMLSTPNTSQVPILASLEGHLPTGPILIKASLLDNVSEAITLSLAKSQIVELDDDHGVFPVNIIRSDEKFPKSIIYSTTKGNHIYDIEGCEVANGHIHAVVYRVVSTADFSRDEYKFLIGIF